MSKLDEVIELLGYVKAELRKTYGNEQQQDVSGSPLGDVIKALALLAEVAGEIVNLQAQLANAKKEK